MAGVEKVGKWIIEWNFELGTNGSKNDSEEMGRFIGFADGVIALQMRVVVDDLQIKTGHGYFVYVDNNLKIVHLRKEEQPDNLVSSILREANREG